jgi:6-pyruvoyltetrahydropterin/6-carboxytetrahydropterin synthase
VVKGLGVLQSAESSLSELIVYEISVSLHFSAAHHLPEYEGDCRSIHGHNWNVRATAVAEGLDSTGLAIDFRELKAALSKVLDVLDHTNLNDLPQFRSQSPSAENICYWIYRELAKTIDRPGVRIGQVAVGESPGYEAVYRAE